MSLRMEESSGIDTPLMLMNGLPCKGTDELGKWEDEAKEDDKVSLASVGWELLKEVEGDDNTDGEDFFSSGVVFNMEEGEIGAEEVDGGGVCGVCRVCGVCGVCGL